MVVHSMPLTERDSGNSCVMVVGDYFICWMKAFAIPNQEATTVAQKCLPEILNS